jgi:hypothetical protein
MESAQGGPTTYRVCVQGVLDSEWSDFLGGMQIVTEFRDGQKPTTTLTGRLPDQSALASVLDGLHNLGFVLISLELLAEE